ncbi:MAG: EscU/YscU/HrcU family type III secretion system export apparatus switch protein [Thermodesulfobacteriota bacterium]|nr:EscU/YscU/HrcU family type III secretion system export apparatus switch protein [Thermodesulfobacteriota bacterium]
MDNWKKKIKKAVSLKYEPVKDHAPKVTAKGQGVIADKIIALAKENNIPIHEDPDLVEILSKLDLEEEIPPTVYVLVAEILAFVYRMNERWPGRTAENSQ